MLLNLLAVNLWSPTHATSWLAIIILSLLLGIVHGITPDEHTWPITFSYAIGSYSTKRGLRAGLIFSLAFTIQRALTSELAYLGLSRLFTSTKIDAIIYVAVGVLMLVAGAFIVKRRTILHFDLPFLRTHRSTDKSITGEWLQDPRPWMPAVHGFVAGWGFGAFALILYTVLAPATHSAALAWIPGALFGIGTMIVQATAGGLFGWMTAKKGLKELQIRVIALKTAGNTLFYGGIAFAVSGIVELIYPHINNLYFSTGIHIHNLDRIDLPIILVIFTVLGIGLTTMVHQTRLAFKQK